MLVSPWEQVDESKNQVVINILTKRIVQDQPLGQEGCLILLTLDRDISA